MGINIGGILKNVAPFLASALPGPFGVAAKAFLSGVFGIGEDDPDDALKDAIAKATPEQIKALKDAEQAFSLKMTEMGYQNATDLAKLANDEMANARQREVEFAKVGKPDLTPRILAYVAIAGFIVIIITLMYGPVDSWGSVKTQIINTMLGALGALVVQVYQYYFGSSSGSTAKNAMMNKLADKV